MGKIITNGIVRKALFCSKNELYLLRDRCGFWLFLANVLKMCSLCFVKDSQDFMESV